MSIENIPENIENKEPKSPLFDYMKEKNRTLADDYKNPDGYFSDSCIDIAKNIARILIEEDKKPCIITITGKQAPLHPAPYEGRLSWATHIVCTCDGLVYDPMVGEPQPIKEYLEKNFGIEVDIQIMVSEEKMREFTDR